MTPAAPYALTLNGAQQVARNAVVTDSRRAYGEPAISAGEDCDFV
jgi:hypothetical protein